METTQKIKDVHFFGEMDLNLSMTKEDVYRNALRIAEACGYMVRCGKTDTGYRIVIEGWDYEKAKIEYDESGVLTGAKRSLDDGKTWETLNFEDGLFDVDQSTLMEYNSRIEYGTQQRLPMSQGLLLNDLVKKYNMQNVVRWGYHHDLIGIETTMQYLLWRDVGYGAQFLGIINKEKEPQTS